MLVHQMHPTLLPHAAHLVTVFHKTSIDFITSLTFRCCDRVMVFCYVKIEEMLCWKVLSALQTSIYMSLKIVNFIAVVCRKGKRLMWRKLAIEQSPHVVGFFQMDVFVGTVLITSCIACGGRPGRFRGPASHRGDLRVVARSF